MNRDWNLDDFLGQLRTVKRMGPLRRLMAKIPGMGSLTSRVSGDELEPIERMLLAMTAEERADPSLLEGEDGAVRRSRVARDSDASSADVEALIKQFRAMKRIISEMGLPGS